MKSRVAEILLELEAVILDPKDPFTYASGIKSPIYCDNRVIISDVKARKEIINAFIDVLKEQNIQFDVVAGTATAGIPHAAWIADRLEKPMIYVRSGKKEHGRQNQIEGRIRSGQKVLLVEDLISTGGSSLRCAEAIKDAQADVVACVAIFSYEMKKAIDSFKKADIPLYTLSDFNTLITFAKQKKYIEENEESVICSWNKDPQNWYDKTFSNS